MCTSMWPNSSASMSSVSGRESFMLKTVVAAVGDHEAGVADRAVGGARNAMIITSRLALGPADPVFDRVGGLEEPVKAQLLQLPAQVRHREVRQQDHRVLVDVIGEQLRIEVVLVRVRDVQVVAVAEGRPVQAAVVGNTNHEPKYAGFTHGSHRTLPARVSIRKTGVADARDLHVSSSQWSSHP